MKRRRNLLRRFGRMKIVWMDECNLNQEAKAEEMCSMDVIFTKWSQTQMVARLKTDRKNVTGLYDISSCIDC